MTIISVDPTPTHNPSDFICPSLSPLSSSIYALFLSKGFLSPTSILETDSVGAKLMMIVTELSEAMEAVRDGDEDNFREELADTMIRILHLCGAMGIDISQEVTKKMAKNLARGHRHGRKSGV